MRFKLALAALALAVAPVARAADPNDPAFMWDLRDLYATPAAWDGEAAALAKAIPSLAQYEGKLGNDPQTLYTALAAISDTERRLSRLYTYASLAADTDTRVAKAQERKTLAQSLYTKLSAATAYVKPEIIGVGAAKIKAARAQIPDLEKRFGFELDDILRAAPHTLGDQAEKTLALYGDVFAAPDNLYSIFANGELPFPDVTLSDGKKIHLNEAAYDLQRQAPNRADRKLVFDAFWARLEELTKAPTAPSSLPGSWSRCVHRPRRAIIRARLPPRSSPTTCPRRSIARWSPRRTKPACRRFTAISGCASNCSGSRTSCTITTSIRPLFPGRTIPKFSIADSEGGLRWRGRHPTARNI